MNTPFQADLGRHAAAPLTTPTPSVDDADQPWGYECALPYLQVISDPLESGTDACPRNTWR